MPHLKLDQSLVNEARTLAQHIVAPVIDYSKPSEKAPVIDAGVKRRAFVGR